MFNAQKILNQKILNNKQSHFISKISLRSFIAFTFVFSIFLVLMPFVNSQGWCIADHSNGDAGWVCIDYDCVLANNQCSGGYAPDVFTVYDCPWPPDKPIPWSCSCTCIFSCKALGNACSSNGECCSNICHPYTGVCSDTGPVCTPGETRDCGPCKRETCQSDGNGFENCQLINPNYGQSCNCGPCGCGGTENCDGSCSGSDPTPANYGQSCNCNACGNCGGTIQCGGSCSGSVPSTPCTAGSYRCNGNTVEYCPTGCSWQADQNCDNSDGWTCSGNTKEYRDYYCSGASCTYGISSSQNCNDLDGPVCSGLLRGTADYSCSGGSCNPSYTLIEDCGAKLSVDSDGSSTAYTTAGTVTDYNSCTPSACGSSSYPDQCASSTTLTEYGASGAGITSNSYDCQNYESNYCSGNRYYRQEWGCGSSPGYCNDAAAPDVQIGTDADGDGIDAQCGDSLCDNTPGIRDATRQSPESSCSDGLDNDCDGATDCSDSNCAAACVVGCTTSADCSSNDCRTVNCISSSCVYSDLPACDTTTCPAGKYCNTAGGDCKTPDENQNVCSNCVSDTTPQQWTPTDHRDAGKAYSTNIDVYTRLFDSSGLGCTDPAGLCYDINGNTVNFKTAIASGNCCGDDADEFYKSNYYAGECVSDQNDCVWSTGNAQASSSGNRRWWCRNHEWSECTDSVIGTTMPNMCCGGNLTQAAWNKTTSMKPESSYSCVDGKDNDCDGQIDCSFDPDCAGRPECGCLPTEVNCNDAIDNDCDGLLNCADPDCAGDPSCVCTANEDITNCNDGNDNDCDGLADCADIDCAGSIAGNIKNENTQPIQGASAKAMQNLIIKGSGTSDGAGNYQINALKCGIYDVTASHSNYLPGTKANIQVFPQAQTNVDFTLLLGSSCETDCTFIADSIVHASCDGRNGCLFYNAQARQICDLSQPGWVRDYDANNYIVCGEGTPQPKVQSDSSVSCSSGTIIKVTRIVYYNGKPVKLVVAACG